MILVGTYGFSSDPLPGTWRLKKSGDGEIITLFTCPSCWRTSILAGAVIDRDGWVRPMVVCRCGFHRKIRLAAFDTIRNSPEFLAEIAIERNYEPWMTKLKMD